LGLEADKSVKEGEALVKTLTKEHATLEAAIESKDLKELEAAIKMTKGSSDPLYKEAKQIVKQMKKDKDTKSKTFYLCRSCGWF